jgi:hypothetical protein
METEHASRKQQAYGDLQNRLTDLHAHVATFTQQVEKTAVLHQRTCAIAATFDSM